MTVVVVFVIVAVVLVGEDLVVFILLADILAMTVVCF